MTRNRSTCFLISSPLKAFFATLAGVFFAEVFVMLVLMILPGLKNVLFEALIDAFLLTFLLAPFFWLFIIKPLRCAVIVESGRASNIVANVIDGIITFDEKGVLDSINPAAEQIFGYGAEEMIGRNISIILPSLFREISRNSIQKRLLVDENESQGIIREISARAKDGATFPIDLTLSSICLNDRCLFTGVFRDITERKKTEDNLRKSKEFVETVLNSMSDAISIIDTRDHAIVGVNNVFLNEVGLKQEQVLGKPCYGVTHHRSAPCEPPDDVCPLVDTMESGKPATAEHVHHADDGKKIHVEITTSPIKDEDGKVIQVVHVARDVTERKAGERMLKLYNEKLRCSNSEMQNFLNIASHDLQEPLRKIMTLGDRLQDTCGGSLNANGRDYLKRMQGAAGQMQNRIDSLLVFSRITTTEQPFVPVDLAKVVRGVVSDLRAEIDKTGGHVETRELPTLDADPAQMRQLFRNLIGNGLKFHKEDEPPIVKVSGVYLAAEGGEAGGPGAGSGFYQIRVEDNGIGFDAKYGARIFGVFQRLHGRREYEGTGIGLAVCKKIVERHGGSIAVDSAPGRGATFIVHLPARRTEEDSLLSGATARVFPGPALP